MVLADLYAWGSSKTKLKTEEIKRFQKRLELSNASEMSEETRNEFLLLSKQLDDLLLKQEIFGVKGPGWLSYSMEIGILNFFIPRLPNEGANEGAGTLLRE